jgi:hypothetical protein
MTRVLTLNVGAASETATLSVTGTMLSVTSDTGGTTSDGSLGFMAMTGPGAPNTGDIGMANDVEQINIIGTDGSQSVDIQGGTFTALQINPTIGSVSFSMAPSTFANISQMAGANANLTVNTATSITLGQNIQTQNNGSISLTSSSAWTVGANVTAGGTGAVALSAGGTLTVSPGVSISAGTTVDVNAGGVMEGAGAAINAASLRLQGTGTFTLDQANAVGTLAANVTGVLSFTNSGALTVGTVLGTAGITTGGNNVMLATGSLSIGTGAGQSISAPGATVDLPVSGVTEGTNSVITAAGLRLEGTGTFTLAQANVVGTLAASITGVLSYANSGPVTVGTVLGTAGITTGGNNVMLATGAGLLTIGAGAGEGITATGATVDLPVGGVAEGANSVVTAAGLRLEGTGTFTLTQANAVSTLAASVTGALSFTNSGALTVGTVLGTAGIATGGNNVTLVTGTGLLTIGTGAGQSITAAGATVDINAGGVTEGAGSGITAASLRLQGTGTFTLAQANAVGTLAANVTGALSFADISALTVGTVLGTVGILTNNNTITLSADTLTLNAAVNAGTQSVTLQPVTSARLIDLGTKTANFSLTNAELGQVTAGGTLTIGATNAGNLQILNALVAPATWSTLALLTGGAIGVTAPGSITATSLALSAASGIGSGAAVPTTVTTLAFSNSGSGAVQISNTGLLTIAAVAGVAASANLGTTTTLTATGLLTVNVRTSSAGALDVSAAGVMEGAGGVVTAPSLRLQGTGTFALAQANAAGTLAANVTGVLSFTNSGALTVGTVLGTAGITTGGNNVTLVTGTALLTLGTGAGQSITATAATVDINAGGVTEGAGSGITAANLRLQGTGTFALAQANAVGTLAANVTGALSFTNTGALIVGTVLTTPGIASGGVTLVTGAGLLTIGTGAGQSITATATVDVNSGGVTEGTNSAIVAANLRLQGTGTFTLTQANAVGTLAANVTGALSFTNSGALTVGTVLTTPGITSGANNITLVTGTGLLTLGTGAGQGIIATGATVDINTGGVTEGAGSSITAANLRLQGTGTFTLARANAVGTLAAGITGVLSYANSGPVTVGTVLGTAGITTGGNNVMLATGAGLLTIGAGAGEGITATGATVDLPVGGVTEGANSVITAAGLRLEGTGTFTLTQPNAVGTLAASITGALSFTNGGALTVGTVLGTAGITTGGNNVTLVTGTGLLTIGTGAGQSIAVAGATVDINAGGVTEGAGSAILAASLRLQGTGPFTLAQANGVGTLAANVTGALSFTNTGALIVGTVLTTAGIASGSNNVTLVTGTGLLTLGTGAGQSVTATAAAVDINAGGVTEGTNSAIVAASLRLQGTGAFTLTQANAVGTLAANVTGALSFINGGGLTVGTVLGTAGITTGGNNVTLVTGTGLLTLGTGAGQSITATAATVDINAGGVTEGAGSGITAANLRPQGAGTFTLAQANNAVSTLAANVTGALSFTNTGALTVGTVLTTPGITTGGNNVTLVTGPLTIGTGAGQGIAVAGATVDINASGVAEGTGSVITAGSLRLQGTGTFTLAQANAVGTLAANVTGALSFTNGGALTIGMVLTTPGITSNNTPVSIIVSGAGNPLTVNNAINVGSATVTLTADQMMINAPVTGNGGITLQPFTVTRTIGLGDPMTGAMGDFFLGQPQINRLSTTGTLTIGRTNGTGAVNTGTLTVMSSLTVFGGDIFINGNFMMLPKGTDTLTLNSNSGTITINGAIDPSDVTLTAPGNITINGAITATNSITVTAGTNAAMTGNVTVNSSGSLTQTGPASPPPPAGIRITAASAMQTIGSIVLMGPVSAMNNVTLTANGTTAGAITQSGTGTIRTPATLSTLSQTGTTLNLPGNMVNSFMAMNTTSNNIALTNTAPTLTISGISQSGGGGVTVSNAGNITTTGSITAANPGGAIALTASGSGSQLTVNNPIAAGNANVMLSADLMTFAPGGTVSAGTQSVTLQQVTPARGIDLGTKSAGNLGLTNTELGQMTAGVLIIGNVANPGSILVSANITAPAGWNTLSLRTGGAITEGAANPVLTVTNLALRAGTGIGGLAISQAIATQVSNLAFSNAGGLVHIDNRIGLTIAVVDGLTTSSNMGMGAMGNITLCTDTGNLVFNTPMTAGTGATVRLQATTGAVSQISTAPITADTLGVVAIGMTSNITLSAPTNRFLAVAAKTDGSIVINSATAYSTTVTVMASGCFTMTIAGLSSGSGGVCLSDPGNLMISSISAGSGTLRIEAGGSVTQDPSGSIVAASLGVRAGTTIAGATITLNGSGNQVGMFAATSPGNIQLTNSIPLGVGTVTASPPCFTADAIGVTTTANGSITLTIPAPATGTITIGNVVTAGGTGTVQLSANGSMSDILVNANVSSTSGAITATAGRHVTLNTGNVTTSGNVSLTGTAGMVSEGGTGRISANQLTTNSMGGTMLNSANTVTSFTATNTGGNIALTNSAAPLTIAGITESGGNVTVTNAGSITISGSISATAGGSITLTAMGNTSDILVNANVSGITGPITATAGRNVTLIGNLQTFNIVSLTGMGGTVSQAGLGGIFASQLRTSSVGGTTLNNTANMVLSFTATNTSSGPVTLNNAGDLTITGISQSGGGAVTITSTGQFTTVAGNIMTGAGAVSLTATNGAIMETGTATISTTGLLTTSSVGGTSLPNSNSVASFTATNTSSGPVTLSNTPALSITGVSQSGGGAVTITNTGGITVAGNIMAGAGAVSLTATNGAIMETGTATISTTGLLTTSSVGGTSLTNSNSVASFTATNTTNGNIALTNTAAPLTITGINQSGGGSVTISNSGGLVLTGNITAGTGAVSLTAIGGPIAEMGTASISTSGLLTTNSVGGTTLTNANNAVASFTATNTSSGNIALTNTAAPLTITGINQSGGGSVTISNSGGLVLTGNITAGTGAVSLTAIGGPIAEMGTASISTSGLLTTRSVGGTTLNGANAVNAFNATNTTSGNITLTNTAAPLTITGISQSGGGAVTVTNTGGITLTMAGITTTADGAISLTASGTLTLGAVVTAGGAGAVTITANGAASDIMVNATVSSTSGPITATAGHNVTLNAGTITTSGNVSLTGTAGTVSEAGTGLIGANQLTTNSVGGTTLNSANTVNIFNAANVGGNIALTNTAAPLTITGISQSGGGTVTVTNTGGMTTTGGITTTADGAINLTASGTLTAGAVVTAGGAGAVTLLANGAASDILINANVSSGSGLLTATAGRHVTLTAGSLTTAGNVSLTATGGSINEAGTGLISAGQLTTRSVGGTTLNSANTVNTFNAANTTSGNIALTNTAAPLTITGISQSGGGTVTVTNTGGMTISGGITTTADGAIGLTASGTLTAGAVVTAGGAGTVTVTANGNGSDILVNANISSTAGALTAVAGRNVTLNAGSLTTTGQISLTGGRISEAGAGLISGSSLTTRSATGTILNSANTVGSFNAANAGSNDIALTNTAAPLTITGISQNGGGNVAINNTGGITTTGGITAAANGSIGLNGSGTITLGAVVTAGGSGVVAVNATGAASDILVNATASSGSGALTATAGRNVTLNAGSLATTGSVSLTGNTGTVNEAGAGSIHAGLLTTRSATGAALSSANTVTSFNAANTTSGDVTLTNTADPLTVTGISQAGGGSALVNNTGGLTTTGAITTAAGGSVGLTASGTVTLGAPVTAGGAGAVTATANGAASDVLVNANVSSTSGPITATAGRDLTLGGVGLTTGNNITLNTGRNATLNGTTIQAGTATVTGGAASTLTMNYSVPTTWTINGVDRGAIRNSSITVSSGLQYNSFKNLTGGKGGNSFVFANNDARVSGTINGGDGNNTLDFTSTTAGRIFNITANNAGTVDASGSSPTAGRTALNTDARAGNVVQMFTSIQNLTGGSGDDRFILADGKGLSGQIDGGPGRDTLDYSAYTTPISVVLNSAAPTGFSGTATNINGGIRNMDVLVGSGKATDTLTLEGLPAAATFLVTGDTVAQNGQPFGYSKIGVLNVNGRAGNDLFNVQSTSVVTTISAAGGSATVNVSSDANARQDINTLMGTLANLAGPLTVKGGPAATLNVSNRGDASPRTWALQNNRLLGLNTPSARSGLPVPINYSDLPVLNNRLGDGSNTFEIFKTTADQTQANVTGGAGNDVFAFADGANLTGGQLDGGGGVNTLDYHNYTAPVEVNLSPASALPGTVAPSAGLTRPLPAPTTATGTGHVMNFQNVKGANQPNSAGNFIVGSRQGGKLEGGGANTTLIGMAGAGAVDELLGGGQTSRLIAGGDPGSKETLFGGPFPRAGTRGRTDLIGGQGLTIFIIRSCGDVLGGFDRITLGPLGNGGSVIVTTDQIARNMIPLGPDLAPIVISGTKEDLPTITLANLTERLPTMALLFVASDEHSINLVNDFYRRFLNRPPDASGLQTWTNALTHGIPQDEVIVNLLSSAEYYARNGSTDIGFVQGLYRDLLGRSTAPPEIDFWVGMAAASRASVSQAIVTSDEYRQDQIHSMYQNCFGRAADAGGMNYWMAMMRQGMSEEQVHATLLSSAEYQQRVTAVFGDANLGFVRGLYHDVLQRSPASAEEGFWLDQLAAG